MTINALPIVALFYIVAASGAVHLLSTRVCHNYATCITATEYTKSQLYIKRPILLPKHCLGGLKVTVTHEDFPEGTVEDVKSNGSSKCNAVSIFMDVSTTGSGTAKLG